MKGEKMFGEMLELIASIDNIECTTIVDSFFTSFLLLKFSSLFISLSDLDGGTYQVEEQDDAFSYCKVGG
jgi:hypothetical protein